MYQILIESRWKCWKSRSIPIPNSNRNVLVWPCEIRLVTFVFFLYLGRKPYHQQAHSCSSWTRSEEQDSWCFPRSCQVQWRSQAGSPRRNWFVLVTWFLSDFFLPSFFLYLILFPAFREYFYWYRKRCAVDCFWLHDDRLFCRFEAIARSTKEGWTRPREQEVSHWNCYTFPPRRYCINREFEVLQEGRNVVLCFVFLWSFVPFGCVQLCLLSFFIERWLGFLTLVSKMCHCSLTHALPLPLFRVGILGRLRIFFFLAELERKLERRCCGCGCGCTHRWNWISTINVWSNNVGCLTSYDYLSSCICSIPFLSTFCTLPSLPSTWYLQYYRFCVSLIFDTAMCYVRRGSRWLCMMEKKKKRTVQSWSGEERHVGIPVGFLVMNFRRGNWGLGKGRFAETTIRNHMRSVEKKDWDRGELRMDQTAILRILQKMEKQDRQKDLYRYCHSGFLSSTTTIPTTTCAT